MNIVMIGVQGSGKGTQSKLLSQHLRIPHISVGDIFRDHIIKGSQLANEAQQYIDRGELVPDIIVINMVQDRLAQSDVANGFILDGFPRNGVQLAALEYLRPANFAILLELDDRTAIKRLTKRLECSKCGIIYGENNKPKIDGICDVCGQKLAQRNDDVTIDAVKKRLALYHNETKLLIQYYQWRGILRRFHADRNVDALFEDIKKSLNV